MKLYSLLSNSKIDFSKSPSAIACAVKSGYFQLAIFLIDTGINLAAAKNIDFANLSSSEQGREVVNAYNKRLAILGNQTNKSGSVNIFKNGLFAQRLNDNYVVSEATEYKHRRK